jgi:uncharacterized radical SAM superfamily Fe-S cluster-containing enzyme
MRKECKVSKKVKSFTKKEKKQFEHFFHGFTRSICPTCHKVINAQLLLRDNKVIMRKFCPDHGHSESLVCSDADWYVNAFTYNKLGSIPHHYATQVEKGCPDDCGLCPDHQQHTCMAQIDITNACNLRCPVCISKLKEKPEAAWFLSLEKIEDMLSGLVQYEGDAEILLITGGEPTLHPDILKIIELAKKKHIDIVLLATNGIRIAEDREFVRALADLDAYVYLQFDGFEPESSKRIRGEDLSSIKLKALKNMEDYGVKTALVPVIMKGVNDHELGSIVKYALSKENILCVQIQPLAYVGCGTDLKMDPIKDRVTIPYVLDCLEKQTEGLLVKSDFINVPCHNPECGAVTYIIADDNNKPVVLARHIDVKKHLDFFKNRARVDLEELLDVISTALNDMSLGSSKANKSFCEISRLSSCINSVFDIPGLEKRVTQINVHSFMDQYTFDIERVMKCCIHTLTPDKKLIPFCICNIFHRDNQPVAADTLFRV